MILHWMGVLLCGGAFAQSAAAPEFEAADVRLNTSGDPPSAQFLPSGQVTLRSMTMRMLVGLAWKETRLLPELTTLSVAVSPILSQFNARSSEFLKGGPPWIDSDRFDVVAKGPAGAPPDSIRLMVQRLLIHRFHLVVHREERTEKVYAMVVGKGGHKLKEAQGGDPACLPSIGSDNVYHRDCHNMTMERLAEELPSYAPRFFEGKPVVDATGLKGTWDFRLDWTPLTGGLAGLAAPPGQEFDTGMTIFRTMEKNLGLRLEQRERTMPVIVIDEANQVPTEN